MESSFVQFGGSPFAFTYLNVISNDAAWGKSSFRDVYRYDSPTPIVPEKSDLKLTLTADNNGLPLWNYVKFTLTIRNRSISKATGIKANWLPPYKRTDNGGGAFANVGAYSSKGNYNWWTGDWTINELAAGETAMDGGNTWRRISNFARGQQVNQPNAVAIAPSNPNIIISERHIRDSTSEPFRFFLNQTLDGGTTWKNIWSTSFPNARLTDIEIHPLFFTFHLSFFTYFPFNVLK